MSVLRAALLGVVLAGSAGACGRDATAPLRLQGVFTLRAVQTSALPYAAMPVPVSFAGAGAGDTTRWLGGTFTLSADGTWQERVTRQLVAGGTVRTDTIGGGGDYRARTDPQQRLILELNAGRIDIAINDPVAVISGDTLYHSQWIFAR